jgi:hypothetical protein
MAFLSAQGPHSSVYLDSLSGGCEDRNFALHIAAHPQNEDLEGSETEVTVSGLPGGNTWIVMRPDGPSRDVRFDGDRAFARLTVDNQVRVIVKRLWSLVPIPTARR